MNCINGLKNINGIKIATNNLLYINRIITTTNSDLIKTVGITITINLILYFLNLKNDRKIIFLWQKKYYIEYIQNTMMNQKIIFNSNKINLDLKV